jgi:hypothetical protein
MNVTLQEQHTITHESINVNERVDAALQRLGLADVVTPELYELITETASVVADVGAEAEAFGEFIGSETHGLWVDKIQERKASDFPSLHLGGQASIAAAAVHFNPEYEKPDGGTGIYDYYKQADSLPEKERAMLLLMDGAISYLTLVEAGLVPRPDVLYGETNQRMARLANHFGLHRTDTQPKDGYDGEDFVVCNTYEQFRDEAADAIARKYGWLSERYQTQALISQH